MKKVSKKSTAAKARRTMPKAKTTTRKPAAKTSGARGRGALTTTRRGGGNGKIPEHILVVIPGFMGSKLRDPETDQIVWLDFSAIPLEQPWRWKAWLENIFDKMKYTPETKLVPAGIMDDVVFLKPFWTDPYYTDLLALLESWGYEIDENVDAESKLIAYPFDYDWRQDYRLSAEKLRDELAAWKVKHPHAQVWLMGHSGGGIVARTFLKKFPDAKMVDRLILLASPWDGSPRAVYHLMRGWDVFLRAGFNIGNIAEKTRKILRTFPAIYQIVPLDNFLHDQNGQELDPFKGDAWLDNREEIKLLEQANSFNKEIGNTIPLSDVLCFFGSELVTDNTGTIQTDAAKKWQSIEWATQDSGDGTLPEYTAVFPKPVRNIPVVGEHARIFTSTELQRILKWELLGKFLKEAEPRAAIITEQLIIKFMPTKFVYEPNEPLNMWATVEGFTRTEEPRGKVPVTDARIAAELRWLQALPGSAATPPPLPLPDADLRHADATPGRYEGMFRAPQTEGYYQIVAVIHFPDRASVTLQETIAVEAVQASPHES